MIAADDPLAHLLLLLEGALLARDGKQTFKATALRNFLWIGVYQRFIAEKLSSPRSRA